MKVLNEGNKFIKIWADGVPVEEEAIEQLRNVARLPFVYKGVCAMPDVHYGMGATIGSVIPMIGAIVPAAVGVDVGCGMLAVKTRLCQDDIQNFKDKDIRADVRKAIEKAVPHGRTNNGQRGDRGAWHDIPVSAHEVWDTHLGFKFEEILAKHPGAEPQNDLNHLGTLGTGNHFIEVCVDASKQVWIMLHSGSRGPGNKLASYFIKLAKEACKKWFIDLPDPNLAYFPQGLDLFNDYMEAVEWAQNFAMHNRQLMLEFVVKALNEMFGHEHLLAGDVINCHHNYVAWENHFGKNIMVVRKGAIRVRRNEMGIIPGSMGEKSYIVSGLGNPESFTSCSHGAGRVMSRTAARKVEDGIEKLKELTSGVECVKDATVLDEAPYAYKDIDAVMAAQKDLVETVSVLKQIVCVKGGDEKPKKRK